MNNLSCEDIEKLLTSYIEDKTNINQSLLIEEHLNLCDKCFEKYIQIRNLSDDIKTIENDKKFIQQNISAYIDNELKYSDYLKFNRIITNNSEERENLEDLMLFEEYLKLSTQKNKNILNQDISKKIIKEIKNKNPMNLYIMYCKTALTIITLVVLALFVFNFKNFVTQNTMGF